jgi:putative transposase
VLPQCNLTKEQVNCLSQLINAEWPHQGLGHKKPDEVYATRQGGGASILDYLSDSEASSQELTGKGWSAAIEKIDLD